MEQLKPNPTKVATKWALINLLVSIVLTYLIQFASTDPNSPLKYLGYLPFIIFLILTQKEFKDQQGGYLTFGEGFSAGFRYAVFTSILLALFTYVYLAFLSPEIMQKAAEQARAQMEAKGMSSEDIDKAIGYTIKLGPIIGAFVLAIIDTIIGIAIALVGAAIFKKERSAYDPEPPADPTV
ncbi:DUF4199 domain-containing protein [Mucilaginibacter ginsenosidivorans]|uniref:DUF4199 domain-containing protein n=1 Tax=Mucilaginibacter ginsenosidivorans TaxID=398053 RepID=A0A5B8UZR7_9SPHI|nr:DUF4199 domain-containing protein [Mucilaginibacter ginsenosidivorans]QEC64670.1 DUF4199 domain-containing protein [Mucilaginibacter ginsenosidivorans]